MPPKRKAATPAPISASQPTPRNTTTTPLHNTRLRKRRHSDASDISNFSEASYASSNVKPNVKRTKKKVTVEVEQQQVIPEEDEQSDDASPNCAQPGAEQDDDDDTIVQPAKRARINSPDTTRKSTQTVTISESKMSIKRRTLSPTKDANVAKVKKISRTSLPPFIFAGNDAQPSTTTVSDFHFTPLKTAIDQRVRERVEQNDGRIEDAAQDEADDEERLVLSGYTQVDATQAPLDVTPVKTTNRVSGWERERSEYHNAIVALEKEANEAKGNLLSLAIQINALGFGEDDAFDESDDALTKTKTVLNSIRQSFEEVSEVLHDELPGLSENASNQEILLTLSNAVKSFRQNLLTVNEEATANAALVTSLASQIDGLLNTIADEKIMNAQLRKDHRIHTERHSKIMTETLSAHTKLEEKVVTMEDEHRNTISNMNKEREQTVRDLEGQLDGATDLADNRQIQIDTLQEELKTVEAERDNAQTDLETTTEEKEDAQAALVAKDIELEDVQRRTEHLDGALQELQTNLETLRDLHRTEHEQRESAEQALDERTLELENSEEKVREARQEANALKNTIFSHQSKIDRLEREAREQEEKYETDLAAEVNRREAAAKLAEEREVIIGELKAAEKRLQGLIAEKDEQLAQQDAEMASKDEENELAEATIGELRDTIDEFEGTISELQESLKTSEDLLKDNEAKIDELEKKATALEHDKTNLEARVENQATETLLLQASMGEEMEALNQQNQKLRSVVEAAEKLRIAKDAEFANLKEQFAAFVRTMHNDSVRRRERAALEEEALQVTLDEQLEVLEQSTTPSTKITVQQEREVQRKPQRKRKRFVDSAIGLNGEVLEEEMVGA